jgi:hypothetical protein
VLDTRFENFGVARHNGSLDWLDRLLGLKPLPPSFVWRTTISVSALLEHLMTNPRLPIHAETRFLQVLFDKGNGGGPGAAAPEGGTESTRKKLQTPHRAHRVFLPSESI